MSKLILELMTAGIAGRKHESPREVLTKVHSRLRRHSGRSVQNACPQDPSRSFSLSGNQPDASHKAKQELPPTSSKALTRKKQNYGPRAGEMDPENQDSRSRGFRPWQWGSRLPAAPPNSSQPGLSWDLPGDPIFMIFFSLEIHQIITVCDVGGGGNHCCRPPVGEGKEPFTKPRA